MASQRSQGMAAQNSSDRSQNDRLSEAALRAKIESMQYSFDQQLPMIFPRIPSKPLSKYSSNASSNPSSSASDNVLPPIALQSRSPSSISTSRSSRNAGSLSRPCSTSQSQNPSVSSLYPSTQSSGSSRSRYSKKGEMSAAEIVAKQPQAKVVSEMGDHQESKARAELQFYSRLVPTTSAVPRNPSRILGGGQGLRKSGSLAGQHRAVARSLSPRNQSKSTALTSDAELRASQKDPHRRMMNLSSGTSKSLLARKVANSFPRHSSLSTLTTSHHPPASPSALHKESVISSGHTPLAGMSDGAVSFHGDPELKRTDDLLDSVTSANSSNEDILPRNSRCCDEFISESWDGSPQMHPANCGDSAPEKQPRMKRAPGRCLSQAFGELGKQSTSQETSASSMSPDSWRKLRRSLPAFPSRLNSEAHDSCISENILGVQSSELSTPPGFGNLCMGTPASFTSSRKPSSDCQVLGKFNGDNRQLFTSKRLDRNLRDSHFRVQNCRAEALREAIVASKKRNTARKTEATSAAERRGLSESARIAIIGRSRCIAVEEDRGSRDYSSLASRPIGEQTGTAISGTNNLSARNASCEAKASSVQKASEKARHASEVLASDTFSDGNASWTTNSSKSFRETIADVSGVQQISNRDGFHQSSATFKLGCEEENDPGLRCEKKISAGKECLGFSKDIPRDLDGTVSADVVGANASDAEKDSHVFSSTERRQQSIDSSAKHFNANATFSETASTASTASTAIRPGVSMIDFMADLQARAVVTSQQCKSRSDPMEGVLPPLPDSEEDNHFESVLRSLGWTPPDEDDEFGRKLDIDYNQKTARTSGSTHSESSKNFNFAVRRSVSASFPYYSHFS